MRLLIIDKTAGLLSAHERHQALAELPGVDLHVFGPERWIENGREIFWALTWRREIHPTHRNGFVSGLLRAPCILAGTDPNATRCQTRRRSTAGRTLGFGFRAGGAIAGDGIGFQASVLHLGEYLPSMAISLAALTDL